MSVHAGPADWWTDETDIGRTHIATKGIVQDGLVFNLDAGVSSCYPGTGTAWNDLSGNGYNFTLFNGAAYNSEVGGCIQFDGGNDYATSSYMQPAQDDTTTEFTWCVWANPLVNLNQPIIGNRNTTLNFTKLSSNRFEYYPTQVGNTMPINTWQHITITKLGNSISYYRNNVLIQTTTISGSRASFPFFIGGDNTTPEYAPVKVSALSIYHRKLTESEITKNFIATRSRYGL